MTAQIVFLTLFLGLVSGPQIVQLAVGPGVRTVGILVDDKPAAILRSPPWRAVIDLGPQIIPGQMVAIGYDEAGREITRETQILNLPRPEAELSLTLERKDKTTIAAELRWQHFSAERPFRIEMTLNGRKVKVDRKGRALLRISDPTVIHALKAEVRFRDGAVATREIVFGGQFSYEMPAELTPILVREREAGSALFDSCFLVNGEPVRATALEMSPPLILFVRNGSPTHALRQLRPGRGSSNVESREEGRFRLEGTVRFQWPTAREVPVGEKSVAELFERSSEMKGAQGSWRLLTRTAGPPPGEIRFADAVAVAGVHAARSGQRRAVVLVLGADSADASRHDPSAVRRYLEAIGVPLMVWSLKGARPDLERQWGEVRDISTLDKLHTATIDLNRLLAEQRIAWLAAPPLAALKASSRPDCRYEPVAR